LSKRVVFIVNVEVIENNEFKPVAQGLELHEPVYYKESVIKEAVKKEYPELYKKLELERKSWVPIIMKWFKPPRK